MESNCYARNGEGAGLDSTPEIGVQPTITEKGAGGTHARVMGEEGRGRQVGRRLRVEKKQFQTRGREKGLCSFVTRKRGADGAKGIRITRRSAILTENLVVRRACL